MRVIIFQGGLGNQIFEYAFLQYIKKNIDDDVKYYFRDGNSHNGFEIHKWFDVELTKAPWWIRLYIMLADTMLWKGIITNPYSNKQNYEKHPSRIYDGFWAFGNFYVPGTIRFKADLPISSRNVKLLKQIGKVDNSISIHIRRGDYLKPEFFKYYGNICTIEYYKKAMSIMEERYGNVQYFVFSDDIEWAKENLPVGDDAVFVDWNTGDDSIYDMYIMSRCKHNIIANSTFSFWGARLNINNNTVVYPKKWYNEPWSAPRIFPDEWIGI